MGKNAIMICPKKKGIMFMEMTMEKFVAYLKQLGFVYQGSEIYGGLANAWDFGPLGVELKNNLKKNNHSKELQLVLVFILNLKQLI